LNALPATKASLGDVYLSIVLPKKKQAIAIQEEADRGAVVIQGGVEDSHGATNDRPGLPEKVRIVPAAPAPAPAVLSVDASSGPSSHASDPNTKSTICPTCNQSVDPNDPTAHSTTLHHQLSLPHSHPPSALNRTSMGYTYLSSYGFDVDARLGLGASGSGRLHPVRASNRADKDKLGIGATKEEKTERIRREGLDAGEAKKMEEGKKKKEQRMRDLVYGSDEVNKYLGIEL